MKENIKMVSITVKEPSLHLKETSMKGSLKMENIMVKVYILTLMEESMLVS